MSCLLLEWDGYNPFIIRRLVEYCRMELIKIYNKMSEGPRKHCRTVTLIGYEVMVTCQDRADSSDVTSRTLYFEAESIYDVYRHIVREVAPPDWLEHSDIKSLQLEWRDFENLDDNTVEYFFTRAYSAGIQEAGAHYCDKYGIEVQEWEMPNFIKI